MYLTSTPISSPRHYRHNWLISLASVELGTKLTQYILTISARGQFSVELYKSSKQQLVVQIERLHHVSSFKQALNLEIVV